MSVITTPTTDLVTNRPVALIPILVGIPEELKQRQQWVGWLYRQRSSSPQKKWEKPPVSPVNHKPAKANDPTTWGSYHQTLQFYTTSSLDGIGFMFDASDPYVGVDLDDCRNPETGEISDWATEYIESLNTYTEISPSGTGFKLILRGSLPPGQRRKGNIEVYDSDRYFTITGNVLDGLCNIANRNDEVQEFYRTIFGTQQSENSPSQNELPVFAVEPLPVSEKELVAFARQAKNGQKFARLMAGNTSNYRNDHSAADLALCRILAFWCGPRPSLIDRIFRKSKLYRDKWDKRHFSDGRTYGEATVQTAIDAQAANFDWSNVQRWKSTLLTSY